MIQQIISGQNWLRRRWVIFIALGLLAMAARVPLAFKVVPDGLADDTYISLRYAANLARGLGFVYNPGERVWGTTTPLFTLLLAAGGSILGTEHLETIAIVLTILASLATVLVMAYILYRSSINSIVQAAYLLSLAILPSFVGNSLSGMETPLVLLLMTLSLAFFSAHRYNLMAIACGLLVLARIDTLIWIAVLALHAFSHWRRVGFRKQFASLAFFVVTIAPWFAFAAIYFGQVVPQSLLGKAASSAFERFDLNYVLSFFSVYVPVNLRFWGVLGLIPLAWALGLAGLGAVHLWKHHPSFRPLIISSSLTICCSWQLNRPCSIGTLSRGHGRFTCCYFRA